MLSLAFIGFFFCIGLGSSYIWGCLFLLRPLKIFHFVKEGRNHLQNSGLFLLFCKDIIKSHLEHFTRLSVVKVIKSDLLIVVM